MKRITRIPAGALQFVLFVGSVIAILLMSFVLLSHTHNHFSSQTDRMVEVIRAADQSVVFAMNRPTDPAVGEDIQTTENGISTEVRMGYWGVFRKVTARATFGKQQFRKVALTGAGKDTLTALWLEDRQRPLVLAGDALIRGTAFLPERGIKTGNIRGQGYFRPHLVYGKQEKSGTQWPEIHPLVVQQVEKLTAPGFEPGGEEVELRNSKFQFLQNSFFKPVQVVKGSTLVLEGHTITGNILLWAAQKIVVRSAARLQDVLLLAPEIVIEDGVRGYFQAIASKSIVVGRHCNLAYPSALVVHQKKPDTVNEPAYQSGITVGEGSLIKGILAYTGEAPEKNYAPQISLSETALLAGELYCRGNLELKGTVNGSVYTSGFIAREQGSVYMNHLYKGKIIHETLPPAYAGWEWAEPKQGNTTVKWLY